LKEWTTPDCRNTPSTTNLEWEEIVDAPGKEGNASMPEQVKRPNPWMMMMMMMKFHAFCMTSDTFLYNQMHSIYCVSRIDTYQPHVSTPVHQNYASYLTTKLILLLRMGPIVHGCSSNWDSCSHDDGALVSKYVADTQNVRI
jgi:hypothetical protein